MLSALAREYRSLPSTYWTLWIGTLVNKAGGFAIAPTLAGLVASVSYFALFAVDAATMAIYGAIVALRVPETRPAAAAPGGPSAGGLGTALRDGPFVGFLALTLGIAIVMWQN